MKTKIYNCLFKDNCGKQAGAIYFLDASAVTWISNCAFTGNYISYRYGTTITIASGTVCMNNCSIADDTYALKSTSNNNSGQQNAWINVKPAKLVMSNCTMIGTTRLDTGVLDNGSSCLLRFDDIGNTHYLINNIIAPTGSTRSIWADNSPTINATSNKTGTKTFTAGATYNAAASAPLNGRLRLLPLPGTTAIGIGTAHFPPATIQIRQLWQTCKRLSVTRIPALPTGLRALVSSTRTPVAKSAAQQPGPAHSTPQMNNHYEWHD